MNQGRLIPLEDFLRESYRDSEHADDQAIFRAIPVYVQHLLWQVGDSWAEQPDWYDLLIAASLRHFSRVIFVTVNYDAPESLHGPNSTRPSRRLSANIGDRDAHGNRRSQEGAKLR